MSNIHQPNPYKQHKQVAPSMLDTMLAKAWQFINQGDVVNAKQACNELNLRYPDSSDGWYSSSFLALQLNEMKAAFIGAQKAISLEPEQAKWQIHFVQVLLKNNQTEDAQLIVKELTKKPYKDVRVCTELALVLNQLGQYELSEKYYKKALKLSPKDSGIHFNLASVQRFLGNLKDAELNFNRTVYLNPHDHEAYLQRAGLRKQTEKDNHIEQLEQVLEKGIENPLGKTQVCYALAKELEDIANYQKSFASLKQGADTRRQLMNYDVQSDVATLNQICNTFSSELFIHPQEGCNNDEAIFVLGLPRTGSTLIERIIDSHDEVSSAGELNNFAMVMMNECKKIQPESPATKSELVELTRNINFKSLGEQYIQSTRPATGKQKRFIDKLPLNSLYVGLIHLALPKAKIIHVKRHPLDTCYAIYKQLFTDGYPFSYSLDDLAEYYIAHHKMMAHWETVMPGVMHYVEYEDVVSDIESSAKGLIDYCDLEWQSQCLDFHNNKSASTTASASQVRQPVYNKSVQRFRDYSDELAPLKEKLEAAGINCD